MCRNFANFNSLLFLTFRRVYKVGIDVCSVKKLARLLCKRSIERQEEVSSGKRDMKWSEIVQKGSGRNSTLIREMLTLATFAQIVRLFAARYGRVIRVFFATNIRALLFPSWRTIKSYGFTWANLGAPTCFKGFCGPPHLLLFFLLELPLPGMQLRWTHYRASFVSLGTLDETPIHIDSRFRSKGKEI